MTSCVNDKWFNCRDCYALYTSAAGPSRSCGFGIVEHSDIVGSEKGW